ncbi:hypothetical protein FOA52_001816 [Chlamydomonas sp. UWO 241]|nr:hypothetical protein FOA52_001816 [Chlamydomonas sp. UWO 241]
MWAIRVDSTQGQKDKKGKKVGYLPCEVACHVAPLVDDGLLHLDARLAAANITLVMPEGAEVEEGQGVADAAQLLQQQLLNMQLAEVTPPSFAVPICGLAALSDEERRAAEDAMVINFGEHNGRTWHWVVEIAPVYAQWCIDTVAAEPASFRRMVLFAAYAQSRM